LDRECSAGIVISSIVDLAVEVEVGFVREPLERAFVPDFKSVKMHGIVAQLNGEGAQGKVHFQELFAEEACI